MNNKKDFFYINIKNKKTLTKRITFLHVVWTPVFSDGNISGWKYCTKKYHIIKWILHGKMSNEKIDT